MMTPAYHLLFLLLTLAVYATPTSISAAERILAIPEMMARAQSANLEDAVNINDQRLEFELIASNVNEQSEIVRVYRQRYKGIPIWKELIVIRLKSDLNTLVVDGFVVANIADDISSLEPAFEVSVLETTARRYLSEKHADHHQWFENALLAHSPRLWVALDPNDKAHLVYEFCMLKNSTDQKVSRVLVDVFSAQVLSAWQEPFDHLLEDLHMIQNGQADYYRHAMIGFVKPH